MDAALVEVQITEQLLQRLEELRFLHVPLMNRIEGRIQTKDQLERYIQVLVHKLEGTKFRDEWLIDRIDRLLQFHQRLERYEDADVRARWDAADANISARWDTAAATAR
jgi:hypothetical protein